MSLFIPKEEGLPTQLGALVPRPTAPIPDEWKRIGADLYAHRDTGMLKFTPPTPEAPLKPEPKPVAENDEEWRSGLPPSVGWYACSNAQVSGMFRYWDGAYWSLRARTWNTQEARNSAKKTRASGSGGDFEWRFSPAPPWGRE